MKHQPENILHALRRIVEEKYYWAKATRQIEQDKRNQRTPLLVHTMGKVGSSSIRRTLRECAVASKFSVYGTYYLSANGLKLFRSIEEKGQGRWSDFSSSTKFLLMEGQVLADEVVRTSDNGGRFKVVSMVRDPVATNVSAFFQKHVWWPKGLRRKCKTAKAGCVEELLECFFRDYPHSVPLTWWDMELKTVFGIDILATPFPKDQGYEIYQSSNADVLVLKLERLKQCFSGAFQEFLGIANIEIIRRNEAASKWYSGVYEEFIERVRFPKSYLDMMYDSAIYRNFYSAEELHKFRTRWSHAEELE